LKKDCGKRGRREALREEKRGNILWLGESFLGVVLGKTIKASSRTGTGDVDSAEIQARRTKRCVKEEKSK